MRRIARLLLGIVVLTVVCPGGVHGAAGPALQACYSGKGRVAVDVPPAWNCRVTEFKDGIVVEDREEGCTLEMLRSPGLMTANEAARLYETLYLGENRMEQECAAQFSGLIAWAEELVLGEYAPREGRRWVQAVFARTGGDIIVGLLKCPQRSSAPPPWEVAAAIFASFRELPVRDAEGHARGSGFFSSLYLFLNMRFSQFQKPDSSGLR